jgi:hypothetical protein
MEQVMKIAICSIRHTLLFGVFSVLMLANGPAQSTFVITLFAMGELGATGFLCSLIVRQYRRKSMADSVMAAVVGYTISHIGILTVMSEHALMDGTHAASRPRRRAHLDRVRAVETAHPQVQHAAGAKIHGNRVSGAGGAVMM